MNRLARVARWFLGLPATQQKIVGGAVICLAVLPIAVGGLWVVSKLENGAQAPRESKSGQVAQPATEKFSLLAVVRASGCSVSPAAAERFSGISWPTDGDVTIVEGKATEGLSVKARSANEWSLFRRHMVSRPCCHGETSYFEPVVGEPRRLSRRLQTLRGWGHAETDEFSPEVRARAVRMVMEHESAHDSQWAAMTSIAEKIGCPPRPSESGCARPSVMPANAPGLTTEERERLKQLERENVELRRANEILRLASASPRRSSTADTSDGRLHR